MGRTIRDYENSGKLHDVIRKAHKISVFERLEDLKWNPVTSLPVEGQMVIVSWKGWKIDVGYFVDGMFFHEGWDWAEEFDKYDGWMAMPLPMNWKEE